VIDRHAAEHERDAFAERMSIDSYADAAIGHPRGSRLIRPLSNTAIVSQPAARA
jgi:hypothetical protein